MNQCFFRKRLGSVDSGYETSFRTAQASSGYGGRSAAKLAKPNSRPRGCVYPNPFPLPFFHQFSRPVRIPHGCPQVADPLVPNRVRAFLENLKTGVFGKGLE